MPIVSDPSAYTPEHVLQIDLSKIAWRATGGWLQPHTDTRRRLNAVVNIGGADHHLEAIEICEIDGQQYGVEGNEPDFDDLLAFAGADGLRFETVSIEGRKYVLSMTPFRT